MLHLCKVEDLAESLEERFLLNKQERARRQSKFRRQRWMAVGPGPVQLIGGKWSVGVILAPKFLIETQSQVLAIEYLWSDDKLGEWREISEVQMVVSDAEDMRAWTIDVARLTSGAIIVPRGLNISANCQIAIQLKAGHRVGRLRLPPYVPQFSVIVHFQD